MANGLRCLTLNVHGMPWVWLTVLSFSGHITAQDTRQATGVKVGEVSADTAVIWTRVTQHPKRNQHGLIRRGVPLGRLPSHIHPDELEGGCPGAPGTVRLRYGVDADLESAIATEWVSVRADSDYTHQFQLSGLKSGTVYHYEVKTRPPNGAEHAPLRGRFQTAPPADEHGDVTFTVITGQKYRNLDHTDGYNIYESMLKLHPHFIVPTGDTVYYDSDDPLTTNIPIARHHWHRMYSYPRHIYFHLNAIGYWLKDDHDSFYNDGWPGMLPERVHPFTYPQGLQVYREQIPQAEKAFRTYRWGKSLQVWLVEGRDFRSPNTMPDGPDKTIWGAEQKKWLMETLLASDADWRVLLSATPIVGPDRSTKTDNHSNVNFSHEGDEFRRWAQKNIAANFFIVCGDRHWQYHSVHPETGLHEFSCGPSTDRHAGGSPGVDPAYHRYHRVFGGFLSVSVRQPRGGTHSRIFFRFHAVDGTVLYEYSR